MSAWLPGCLPVAQAVWVVVVLTPDPSISRWRVVLPCSGGGGGSSSIAQIVEWSTWRAHALPRLAPGGSTRFPARTFLHAISPHAPPNMNTCPGKPGRHRGLLLTRLIQVVPHHAPHAQPGQSIVLRQGPQLVVPSVVAKGDALQPAGQAGRWAGRWAGRRVGGQAGRCAGG